jgi:AcrR family transcriptional regulator
MRRDGVRRSPVQQRSVERVNQMLDAAAALLDEGGHDALTTRAVAARAGVPIGSIYRFFHDKRGLAEALTRRNLAEFLDRVRDRLQAPTDWAEVCDLLVDTYVEMMRTTPGFAVLDFSDNAVVAAALGELLYGGPPREDDRRVLLVSVEAADALLKLAFRTDPSGDPAVVAETKLLLRAYLERTLAAPVSS